MLDAHADRGNPARLSRWVSGALMLLGLASLACAGYSYWESRSSSDTAPSPQRGELVVDNPHYVASPPIKGRTLEFTFALRNPGARPTRVISANKVCNENVCSGPITDVPMVIPPGESREFVIGCSVRRAPFSVTVPLY